jgi:hypothetical protein
MRRLQDQRIMEQDLMIHSYPLTILSKDRHDGRADVGVINARKKERQVWTSRIFITLRGVVVLAIIDQWDDGYDDVLHEQLYDYDNY